MTANSSLIGRDRDSSKLIRRLFLSLLPVQALAVGLPAINALLSCFIIGNFIGSSALAAIGFAGPLTSCLTAVGSLLAVGGQMLCGQFLGKGDRKGVERTFSSTIVLCLLFGAAFTAVCLSVPTFMARLLGAAGELRAMAADYIRGLAVGMVFALLSTSMLPFLQLDRARKTASASVTAMVAVNIGFNFLNAFVLHWGMLGVGLATALANIASVLVALPHFLFKSKTFRIHGIRLHAATVGRIFYLGFPSAISPLCFVFRDRIVNQFIFTLGGTTAMSALTVANNITLGTGGAIEGGYSGSTNLIASVLVGERDSRSTSELPGTVMKTIHYIYILTYAAIFVFAKPLALLFGAEPEHIAVYIMVIRVYNLWFITNTFKTPTLSIYRALGMVTTVSVFYILNGFVFPALCCVALGNTLGLWWVVSISWTSEVLLIAAYVVYYVLKTHCFPRSIDTITYIPDSLSTTPDNRCDATIRTLEDAVAASQRVIDFCLSKGLSQRVSNYCGLCIEEMAADTITHGFTKGKTEQYSIDLRLIYEDGGVSVMLRDNSEYFDPTEWLKLYAPDDPMRSIGIKMVSKLSKEMNYTGTLGLNVLTIKL